MRMFLLMCLVSMFCWQGCNQGHSTAANKEDNFEHYVNTAESSSAAKNEQSNAIVNVAF